MFSPGTKKKSNYTSRKQQPPSPPVSYGSPVTPAPENRKPLAENVVPDRPSTGTPAPWASSRLSVLARYITDLLDLVYCVFIDRLFNYLLC